MNPSKLTDCLGIFIGLALSRSTTVTVFTMSTGMPPLGELEENSVAFICRCHAYKTFSMWSVREEGLTGHRILSGNWRYRRLWHFEGILRLRLPVLLFFAAQFRVMDRVLFIMEDWETKHKTLSLWHQGSMLPKNREIDDTVIPSAIAFYSLPVSRKQRTLGDSFVSPSCFAYWVSHQSSRQSWYNVYWEREMGEERRAWQ